MLLEAVIEFGLQYLSLIPRYKVSLIRCRCRLFSPRYQDGLAVRSGAPVPALPRL